MASTSIIVLGHELSAYSQYTDNLSKQGFDLLFIGVNNVSDIDKSDIYIVSMDLLINFSDALGLVNKNTPYLIAEASRLPKNNSEKQLFLGAVGIMTGQPAFHELILAIELGLSRHSERQSYNFRLKDFEEKVKNNRVIGVVVGLIMCRANITTYDEAFEYLRITSRKKQRRISDVAVDITSKLTPLKSSKATTIDCISNFNEWLEENIHHKDKIYAEGVHQCSIDGMLSMVKKP